MQTEKIIEKAKQLGLDTGDSPHSSDRLRLIASQVGLNEFNSIYDVDKLDKILDDKLKNKSNSDMRETSSNENEGASTSGGRFGEAEYNAAKNKDGVYDKDYYKNKRSELDQKLEEAKAEKNRDFKKKDPNDDRPVQADGSNTAGKNKFDKLKDNVNLAKAKANRVQNSINSAKAKWFNATHPGQALKDKTKQAVKNAGKNVAKKAGQAATKAGKTAAKALGKSLSVLAKNPYFWLVVGIIVIVLILIIIISGVVSGGSGENSQGLYGYEYVEPEFTQITITNGESQGTYDLEEYVAGVVQAEFSESLDSTYREAAKAGAIATRSHVLTITEDGKIDSSSNAYKYITPTQQAIDIANETRGLVLVNSNEEIITAKYDSFCTNQPPETDSLNYILCQKNQLIPKEWADSKNIEESWKQGTMYEHHGYGMSKWGAVYLSEQGKTYTEILDYYYENAEIYSVYASMVVGDNWTTQITTWASSSIPTTILRQPLTSLMSRNEYTSFNQLIRDAVVSKGVGTRDAIVAAAVLPIKYLAENYNVVIPYTLGGGHYMKVLTPGGVDVQTTTSLYYGLDPKWGTIVEHTWKGNYYDEYGPDCSAWVPWVFKNAGVKMIPALGFSGLGTTHKTTEYVAKPGDLLEGSGHVMVIVGVDQDAGLYYISHASGGNNGTIISTVSMKTDKYYIVDMGTYIQENVIQTYEEDFMKGLLNY